MPTLGRLVEEHRVPSSPTAKDPLVDLVVARIAGEGWIEADDETWLRLCLEEAVANAIYHGNEGDPDLSVTVRIWVENRRWVVTVDDEGEGFTPAEIPDAEDSEALLRESGRGLLIMREWLDELRYYRAGACALLAREFPARHTESR